MPDVFPDKPLMYTDQLPGGAHWSMRLRRGVAMKITDINGGANVGMLMYNPDNLLERYNAPDSLKCQHTFKLTRGHCLYSDMGRIFCSITDDTVGWHDTVGGNLSTALLQKKYAVQDYQDARNDWMISGQQSFMVELAKYGLTKRDITANLNLFSCIRTDDEGNLSYIDSNSAPGSSVTLRFEMDTLVILHTCPHPMNPATEYPRCPISYELLKATPPAEDDYCRNLCEENQRGFLNNQLYHLQGGY